MTTELNFTVEETTSPTRIDKFIASQTEDISRNRIKQLIEEKQVFLNDEPICQTKRKVAPGDHIRVCLPPLQPSTVEPEDIDFSILYEDEHVAVIDKPAGLCVHPTDHIKTGTLVNGLLYKIHDLSGIGGVLRPGIVHRLDRVTSGILVIAKNNEAHRKLSECFKTRRIKKIYWAIVHGIITKQEGEIDLPIGRHPSDRKRMTIREDGRNSLTRYRITSTGLGGSLVKVYPRTGRTHQIRVHLHHLGLSIVGDALYGLKKHYGKGRLARLFEGYPGIALHAHELRFPHPATDEIMEFQAPLPQLLKSVVDKLTCLKPNDTV